jgi:hypothetical protein
MSAKQVVPWIIGSALIVALAGFTCGACAPRLYALFYGSAPVAPEPPGGREDEERAGGGSPGLAPAMQMRGRPPSPHAEPQGCLPWGGGEAAPARPPALRRLSDMLTRRVRLVKIIMGSGAGAGASAVDFSPAVSPRGASRSNSAVPPPLPERPWRSPARREAFPADDDGERTP